MTLSIIAAISENGVIGRNGDLPWYLPEDLKRFKRLTLGHTLVMGRRTAENIIERLGGPLPNRNNVVLTRSKEWRHEGFEVVYSWEAVQHLAWEETIAHEGESAVFVIGGAQVYKLALPHAQRLYITHVRWECEGDAFFPVIDPTIWRMVHGTEFLPDEKNAHRMTFCVYTRV